jgi:hypothetical protein
MTTARTNLSDSIRRLIEGIDAAALRNVPVDLTKPGGRKEVQLRRMLTRSERVIAASRTARTRPDGFASTTPGNGSPGGGKGGGRMMAVETPADEPGRVPQDPKVQAAFLARHRRAPGVDLVPTSSTEAAALAAGRRVASPIDDIANELVTELRRLDTALRRIGWALDRYDRIVNPSDGLDEPPQCWVASKIHGLPWDRDWEPFVSTRFEGVLEEPWPEDRPVCRWVYDFTRRHARVPTKAEMRQYLERGQVRVQTGAAS